MRRFLQYLKTMYLIRRYGPKCECCHREAEYATRWAWGHKPYMLCAWHYEEFRRELREK
jgi:hypothetical protein